MKVTNPKFDDTPNADELVLLNAGDPNPDGCCWAKLPNETVFSLASASNVVGDWFTAPPNGPKRQIIWIIFCLDY